MADEVEIKFAIDNVEQLCTRLRAAGFREDTPSTHEVNVLFDLPGLPLKSRGELLRVRKFGDSWVLTHKAKKPGLDGPHKSRIEMETRVDDGEKLMAIFQSLGYEPVFRYEKFRAEWSDGTGHVLVDQTPVGNYGEIEGPPEWIDATAQRLGITRDKYITSNYATLFREWRSRTGSRAENMTFADCAQ